MLITPLAPEQAGTKVNVHNSPRTIMANRFHTKYIHCASKLVEDISVPEVACRPDVPLCPLRGHLPFEDSRRVPS